LQGLGGAEMQAHSTSLRAGSSTSAAPPLRRTHLRVTSRVRR
jgi:hypothetical protein